MDVLRNRRRGLKKGFFLINYLLLPKSDQLIKKKHSILNKFIDF